jgi:hypothetical protein
VAILVRDMRRTWAPLRSSMHIPSKRQMPKEDIWPEPPTTPHPSMGGVAVLNDQTRDESARHRAEAEPRTESLSTSATVSTRAPNDFPEEGLRSLKGSLSVQDSDPTASHAADTPGPKQDKRGRVRRFLLRLNPFWGKHNGGPRV